MGVKTVLALLAPRPEIEDRAGRVEHRRQQDELQAGGEDHEQRVDHGDPGEDQVAPALLRPRLVALAARASSTP